MTEKIIGDVDVACELVQTVNEQDGKCSVRPAPLCRVTNLLAVVLHQLEQLRSYNMLTWHENSGVLLPKDEIWLEFGRDKDGGSFKFCNQIVNRHRPNSADHTMVILCLAADDSLDNMHIAMDPFHTVITELNGMRWR